jgi:hypothetical protein
MEPIQTMLAFLPKPSGYHPSQSIFAIRQDPQIRVLSSTAASAGIFHDGKRNLLMVKTNTSWASDLSKSNYPKFQSFLYSIDPFLPIVNLGQKDYWAPNANIGSLAKFPLSPSFAFKFTWGSALRLYLILHIILGWIFTTLWVAGFTGLVRKLN